MWNTNTMKNIFLAIPIGGIYNLFMHKLTNVLLNDMEYETRYQYSLIILFMAGVASIAVAQTVFSRKRYFKNKPLKYGLTGGGITLLFYSLVSNWDRMHDVSKLFIMGLVMTALLYYAYNDNEKVEKDTIKEQDIDNTNTTKNEQHNE